MKKFQHYIQNISEEIDVSTGEFFDPSAKREMEQSTYDVESVLPGMSENGKRYFELIIEGEYERLVKDIQRVTGMQTPTKLAILSGTMSSMAAISKIEEAHRKNLEALAVKTILGLKEYTFIRKLVQEGELRIVAEILKPDLQAAFNYYNKKVAEDSKQASGDDLTPGEEAELDLIDIMQTDKGKSTFINFIMQGEAVNTWSVFKVLGDELDVFDTKLISLYDMFVTGVRAGYFLTPFIDTTGHLDGAVGSAEVQEEGGEGVYTIYAQGINFAIVLHEIVKGCHDYLGLRGKSDEDLKGEDINDELLQLKAGSGIARQWKQAIANVLGDANFEYIQPVYGEIYHQMKEHLISNEDIQEILKGTPHGKQIIKDVLEQVKAEQDSYDSAKDEHENPSYQDSGESDEGGEDDDSDESWK